MKTNELIIEEFKKYLGILVNNNKDIVVKGVIGYYEKNVIRQLGNFDIEDYLLEEFSTNDFLILRLSMEFNKEYNKYSICVKIKDHNRNNNNNNSIINILIE